MADILVLDWMEEYDSLTESEIHTYATEQEHNQEVMLALFALLEEPQQSRKTDLIERICKQFLNFYRSGEKSLRRFVMQYIPSFVWLHLSAKEVYPEIETLLLSLYNLEVVDGNGQSKIISFRVPSLAQNSIYHDSSTLEPAFIAENSLRRYEECNTKLVNWGPLPQVESLNAQNRQRVVTALVFLYNQDASSVPATNVECICRVISKIINQGFQMGGNRTSTDSENSQTNSLPRLIVSNTLLLELLHIVYNALQRGINGASQTLRDIYQRATYETYADVLLATHALQSLVHQTPTANLHLKPPSKPHVSKSMITNASFRTKKLPDDIPIQRDEEATADASLDSIVEEGPETGSDRIKLRGRSGSALKHLPKLSGLKKQRMKSSPTPHRHSIENEPPVMELPVQAVAAVAGGGEQVSLISGNFQENNVNNEGVQVVSTV